MQFFVVQNNPVATSLTTYRKDHEVFNWSHKITATNGFDSAIFDLVLSNDEMEQFFDDGLGRMVTRYSEDGNTVIWQGYINSMTLTQPGSRSGLSLDNMFNLVGVKYTQINSGLNPPGESSERTTKVQDTDSQDKYGIKQITYSPPVEKLKQTVAEQMRDTFLEQYREPRRSASVVTRASEPRLHIKCKGYKHTLSWIIYRQVVGTGDKNANLIIADMLSYGGQFINSSELDTNTSQVHKYYNDAFTILELVDNIAGLGDSSDNRWVAYVKENRTFVYELASTAIKYFRRLSDPTQSIYDAMGRKVPYWEIQPNAWIKTTDIQPFIVDPTALQDNPQLMYIESVDWSENNNSLSMTGSRGDAVGMLVAKIAGLGETLL